MKEVTVLLIITDLSSHNYCVPSLLTNILGGFLRSRQSVNNRYLYQSIFVDARIGVKDAEG